MSAAGEMAASSRKIATDAKEQTGKTTKVASAIQEMASTVNQVSRHAEEVARASRSKRPSRSRRLLTSSRP